MNWKEASAEMVKNGTPVGILGYCQIAYEIGKASAAKIDPNMSIEDVLMHLISEAGYNEVHGILTLLKDRYTVECCNENCGWVGYSVDCSIQPHAPDQLLCPECRENAEPVEY